MPRFTPAPLAAALVCAAFLLGGADGCSSDPDVEGAKLYIRSEQYDEALTNLDRAIANNPENADAYALKGEVLRLQADRTTDIAARKPLYEEMAAALDRATALDPANADVGQTRLAAWAKEMNAGGGFLRQSGDDSTAAARAVGSFENAVVIQPDSAASHFNLGLAYLVQGRTDAAVGPLQRAVDSGDASADAYRYLGRALVLTDQGSQAVEVLEEGAQRYPDDEALRAELLNAYAATDQPDRAVTAYEAMVAANPDDPLIRYNYGSTLLQLGRFDEAIEQLEAAVELDPTNPDAQYNLGAAYQNEGFQLNERLADEDLPDAEAQEIRQERDTLFEQAIPYLVEARRLTEAAGEDASDICNALFQVYTPIGRLDEAEEAAECAGMDMN